MIRAGCFVVCLILTTKLFGIESLIEPLCSISVQEEVTADGQTITMLKVGDSYLLTDQEPFRFNGSSSELFAELNKKAKRQRIIQKMVAASVVVLVGGSVLVYRRGVGRVIAKHGNETTKFLNQNPDDKRKYIISSVIMTSLFVSSIATGVSVPFLLGDHGFGKHRDKIKWLLHEGQAGFDSQELQEIKQIFERYLGITSEMDCPVTVQSLNH